MTYSTSKESPNHQIVFLVYTARSGSTFLASALDSFEEIGVSIEDSLPGGLAFVDEFSDNFHSLLTAFQQDIKFKSWNILSNDLKQILENKSGNQILPSILSLLFTSEKPKSKTFVYKAPEYIYIIEKIFRKFPDSKVLHIYRDPRAVFASQKNNLTSNKKNTFINNPYVFCNVWKRVMKHNTIWKEDTRFFPIKYEDLVENFEEQIQGINRFLGVNSSKTSEIGGYQDKIPEDQKHLHKLVGAGPTKERIDGWKKEITAVEVDILEKNLRKEMQDYGYELIKPHDVSSIIKFFIYMKYIAKKIYNLSRLMISFKDLKWRIKLSRND